MARSELLIGLIGGTGRLGRGLALRLSANYNVMLGSRYPEKAKSIAASLTKRVNKIIEGGSNEEVAKACNIAILSVPYLRDYTFIGQFKESLADKLVISPVVPMKRIGKFFVHMYAYSSAAERIQKILSRSRVVAALHNVPASKLEDLASKLSYDVLISCDNEEDFQVVAKLIESIDGLRALYTGPLYNSRFIEAITPLLLNISRYHNISDPSIKVV